MACMDFYIDMGLMDVFLKNRYNVFFFFLGIFLWFAVGFMWKDKAIMVVHFGAFISLLIGYLNA